MCDSGSAVKRMIRCVKETRPQIDDGRNYCVWRLDRKGLLEDLLDGADPGEKIVLTVCEMDEAELEALPEFEGW